MPDVCSAYSSSLGRIRHSIALSSRSFDRGSVETRFPSLNNRSDLGDCCFFQPQLLSVIDKKHLRCIYGYELFSLFSIQAEAFVEYFRFLFYSPSTYIPFHQGVGALCSISHSRYHLRHVYTLLFEIVHLNIHLDFVRIARHRDCVLN